MVSSHQSPSDYGSSLNLPFAIPNQKVNVGESSPNKQPPGKVVVSAKGIRKSYAIGGENRRVLDDLDFEARAGENVFLSGPSGSGKSTLLAILGCLLGCDQGSITISNHRVDGLTIPEKTLVRRTHIGFVFQRFQLFQALSAEDNVAIPLTLNGVSYPEAIARSRQLLRRVGLAQHRTHLPRAMSPGQCQRVALARAIITKPKLVLADEPTAALDSKSGEEVMVLLSELIAGSETATVVVTHDPRILKYADRVCEIENGRFK